MSTFHHAYNGIPTLRSNESFFEDGEPAPLDHLAPGTYSGTLKLTIETKTPLITACHDTNGRLVVPSASGNPDGAATAQDAMIPATSLKGVLSSAFEAITQSRFRVFGDHTKLPQFRYMPDHKPKRQAAFLRFEEETAQWSLHIQDYAILPDSIKSGVIFTTNNIEVIGGRTSIPVLDNKGKQKYDKKGKPIQKQVELEHDTEETASVNELLEEVRKKTTHLTKINSFDAFEQKFWGQIKMVVSKVAEIPICKPKHPDSTGPIKHIQRTGWIVRLNIPDNEGKLPDNKRLIDTKYNEYIFYAKRGKVIQIQLHPEEISRFADIVLAGARFQHQKEQDNDTQANGQHSLITRVLSRIATRYGNHNLEEHLTQEYIYQALIEEGKAEPGIPVFTTNHRHKGREIVYSYLGRSISLSSLSPSQVADRTEVRPARSFQEATAADRLWGFVTQSTSEEFSPALKGRIYLEGAYLRVGSLKKAEIGGWIPPILSSPKPWTAQPYLRSIAGKGVFDVERSECFTEQHSLIRKTYPTHRFLTSKKASPTFTPTTDGQSLAGSEVLIGSYIEPGATLESKLRFEGLSVEEISTILWLLTPENLVPKREQKPDKKGYFHLGLGKPLGLGTASISAEVLSLYASHSLADGYINLDTILCHNLCEDDNEKGKTTSKIPESISDALPDAIKEHSSLAVLAFVRSAYGWKKDEAKNLASDPVSYTPYPDSEKKSPIIDYFKEYEQKRIKGEAQRFEFRMLPLEEDNDSRTMSAQTTGATHTAAGQTPTSNAAQNASSPRKSKAPAPRPGPGLRRVTRH